MKELAIGEIGEIDGVKVKCVGGTCQDGGNCPNCLFHKKPISWCFDAKCTPAARRDNEFVYYQEVKS